MGESEENTDVSVSTSQMCKGNCATVIWHLKGWNEDAVFLKDNAACVMEVPPSPLEGGDGEGDEEPDAEGDTKPEEPPPQLPVKFRFFFGDFERQRESKWKSWFSLWVTLLSVHKRVSFLVEVVEVEEEAEEGVEAEEENGENEEDEESDDEEIEMKAQITMKGGEDDGEVSAVVKEEFIPMKWWKTDGSGNKVGEEHLTEWAESEELKIKISVTIYEYSGTDAEKEDEVKGEEQAEQEEENQEEEPIPMIRDLKAMYSQEENYADVTLETRDGMILNAHKFVLAARSSYFRGIIEKEVKKKGFTGLIKLSNVDGKPMTVVLHWMYTDEILEEQLGKVMDEVIKVSVKWELKDLLKMLDKKLISVCNTRNMLHLFQVAHKNGLYTAIADISEYIKENIDSVLPTRRTD